MTEKILLDTDIGSDIDDAICLAYLLNQPKCELLGVTTVSGEAARRAQMVSAVCIAAGKPDIPVYPGTEAPLLTPQKQPLAPQSEILHKWEHKKDFPVNEHIEFMRQVIRANPGEVTLLAIGPMTNIALLFTTDPEIPALLKQLVVMCGVFDYKTVSYTSLTEWNALCDPYAAAIMYSAPVKAIKSIGLDVTTQVTMPGAEASEKFSGPVRDFLNISDYCKGTVTFHDPLSAAVIFDETICGFKKGTVEVELESSRSKGLLYFNEAADGNNQVAFSVDSGRFFENFFGIVK
jgi:inosine-uridine nucleoside N-ribohydrolase